MYAIEYKAPSGRKFIHMGTHSGITDLLSKELKGVTYHARVHEGRLFKFGDKQQIEEEKDRVTAALHKRAEARYLARQAA